MDKLTYLLTAEPGGICVFDREPTNSQHSHRYWEICLVLNGTGEYIEGGEVYDLRTGSLFASPPDVVHEIRSPVTRDLELFFVSFTIHGSPGGMDDDDATIGAFLRGREVLIQEVVGLEAYVGIINGATNAAIANQLARLFALEAMDRLRLAAKSDQSQITVSPDVRRALELIRMRCEGPMTVGDVASPLSLSARTIHRKFLNQVGHSVAKEIRQQKMRRAAHLLLMGYSVQEVANRVGIGDSSQFSAAFLAEIGSRPKRFQQTYLPGKLG